MIQCSFNAYGSYRVDSVYQWDKDRTLKISGLSGLNTIPEVHFTNSSMEYAIIRRSILSGDNISVTIPNSLLQQSLPIKVYIYSGVDERKTVDTIVIPVIARNKPADYTIEISDNEVYSFAKLESAISQMATKNQVANIIATNNNTEGNSELVDIRTDVNGNVHTSAGEAVRTQFENVNANLFPNKNRITYTDSTAVNLVNKASIIKGKYVDTAGSEKDSTDWNLTDFVEVSPKETLYLYRMGITCFYNSNKQFISYVQNVNSVTVPANAIYFRSCVTNEYLEACYIARRENLTYIYDNGYIISTKKDYSSGYIPFTVKVNQTKADNTLSGSSEGTENYIDVDCIVRLPKMFYTPHGKPCKLLMICHGAGQSVTEWKEHTGYNALVEKFLSRGYVVFDCNGFNNTELGYSFWGDPRGVSAWRKAYQYIVDNYNVEKVFSIYAFSMGGLTAMNLAFSGFPNIRSIALGSPVLNLEACYNDSGVSNVIKTLYGMGDTYDSKLTRGSNPYSHILSINGVPYIFKTLPPIKIWYGSTETGNNVAVEKAYAQRFVTAITNAGGYAEYREVSGGTHSICYGMDEYCNNDYLIFTERFSPHYDTLFS